MVDRMAKAVHRRVAHRVHPDDVCLASLHEISWHRVETETSLVPSQPLGTLWTLSSIARISEMTQMMSKA